MRNCLVIVVLISVLSAKPVYAQTDQVFNGVKLGDPVDAVKERLNGHCEHIERFEVKDPSFPMASAQEDHLICSNFSIYDGYIQLDEASFTFADNSLKLIEARGDAVDSVFSKNTLHDRYKIYAGPDTKIIEPESDSIWFLDSDGMHINLFAWSNPYLPSNAEENKHYDTSAKPPAIFKFGESREELLDVITEACDFISIQDFGDKTSQINCFGLVYAGFPRKMEARFGAEGLELVWILTGKAEEKRIEGYLLDAFGRPVFENDKWTVFNDWQVSLRKDKPEILLLSADGATTHKQSLLRESSHR